jgi:hypothetical protein
VLLDRWRREAEKTGHKIKRITVAFEAGRDGFWLARWHRALGIEAHVIHAASVAVPREHRRAKTDRLDTELLKRAFLGWRRRARTLQNGRDPDHRGGGCRRPSRERESRIVNRMKAALVRLGIRGFNPKLNKAANRLEDLRTPEGEPIPPNTLSELSRDLERRRLVMQQIRQIEAGRLERLQQAPKARPNAMVRLLARVKSISVETADMLVQEALSCNLRDRRASSALVLALWILRAGGAAAEQPPHGTSGRENSVGPPSNGGLSPARIAGCLPRRDRSGGRLVGGMSPLCSRSRFEAVKSVEEVLDVRGKFLARDIFRRPSERRADAIEEVDVVNADCVF